MKCCVITHYVYMYTPACCAYIFLHEILNAVHTSCVCDAVDTLYIHIHTCTPACCVYISDTRYNAQFTIISEMRKFGLRLSQDNPFESMLEKDVSYTHGSVLVFMWVPHVVQRLQSCVCQWDEGIVHTNGKVSAFRRVCQHRIVL